MQFHEFAIKFNLHKLIGFDIDENVPNLARIFDCNKEWLEVFLSNLEQKNIEHARKIIDENNICDNLDKETCKTIVFIGDSITSDREGYLNIIKMAMRSYKNIKFIDASVSCSTSAYSVLNFHEKVERYKPDVASIMIGTNDLLNVSTSGEMCIVSINEYERNLNYILQKFNASKTKVILNTIPPVDEEKCNSIFLQKGQSIDNKSIENYNEVLIELGKRNGAVVNDMSELYLRFDTSEITIDDGVHLNSIGHEVLASKVYFYLMKLLF